MSRYTVHYRKPLQYGDSIERSVQVCDWYVERKIMDTRDARFVYTDEEGWGAVDWDLVHEICDHGDGKPGWAIADLNIDVSKGWELLVNPGWDNDPTISSAHCPYSHGRGWFSGHERPAYHKESKFVSR